MQTHYDNQHDLDFLEKLRGRADAAEKAKASLITVGQLDEPLLGKWKATNGMHVRHMPDDEQGILRISCGGGDHLPVTMNYMTIRGPVSQCIDLLEKALVALRECPE